MSTEVPPKTIPSTPQKVSPLAVGFLQQIQLGALDPTTLKTEQRQLVVRFMMHAHSYTLYEMAEILKVNRNTIIRDKKQIRESNEMASLVIDEGQMAIEIIEAAEHAASKLTSQKKYKDAWTVRKECIETLQNMGYIKKVEQKLNIRGQIDILQILNAELQIREGDSPGKGDEDAGADTGVIGSIEAGSTQVEQIPQRTA